MHFEQHTELDNLIAMQNLRTSANKGSKRRLRRPHLPHKMKEKRSVLKRSVWILLTKNSVLQIDEGNLINRSLQYKTTLKYIMRSKRSTPTMRQFVRELRKTWTSSKRTVPAFDNWFTKTRTTQIDMLFNERPTTKSIIQSLQSRIKTNDSWSWEHRIVWIARHGTQNAVQSMFVILGHWHRLLHVRALLAKRKRGKSENHQIHDGPSFNSRVRHQERTTSRTPIR